VQGFWSNFFSFSKKLFSPRGKSPKTTTNRPEQSLSRAVCLQMENCDEEK
jgi:hypothetical protein